MRIQSLETRENGNTSDYTFVFIVHLGVDIIMYMCSCQPLYLEPKPFLNIPRPYSIGTAEVESEKNNVLVSVCETQVGNFLLDSNDHSLYC